MTGLKQMIWIVYQQAYCNMVKFFNKTVSSIGEKEKFLFPEDKAYTEGLCKIKSTEDCAVHNSVFFPAENFLIFKCNLFGF